MKNVWTIFYRELRSYFVSPVAYTLLVAFLVLPGWFFYNLSTRFLLITSTATEQAIQLQQVPPIVNVNMGVMRPWFSIVSECLLFLTPIMTMRLLAEERGTGRLDLLLSAPLTELQLVLGKYLAGLAFCWLFFAATLVYPLILFAHGNPEPGQIVSGYIGLCFLSLTLMALGLMISALTNNQVVAAAATFGVVLLLWVLGIVAGGEGTHWGAALASVSMLEHFHDFADGVIALNHITYYVTFAVFLLFLTVRAVESQRWRG